MSNPISSNPQPGTEITLSAFPRHRISGPAPSSEGPKWNIHIPDSLKRHWIAALLVFAVTAAGGGFALLKVTKPVYSSHSVVYVSPKFPKLLSGDSELERPYESYVADEVHTVTRYDIIADAIESLPESVRGRTGAALPFEVQTLQRSLDVERIGNTYQVSIELKGPKPIGLAETVNAITEVYLEKAKNEEFFGRDERLNTLKQERQRLQKDLDDHFDEYSKLMADLGVARISPTEGGNNPYDTILMRLRDQLATARMQRQSAEAQLATVSRGGETGSSSVLEGAADEAMAADPGLSTTRSALNARRMTLMSEMSGLKPDHPIYQKDKTELASIDAQLNDLKGKATSRIQDKLRAEVTRTRMIELQLSQEIAQKTSSATAAAPKFQRAVDLGSELDRLQKASAAIDDRIRDIELESSSPGSIHLFSKALPPLGPEHSKLNMYLGALLFFCLTTSLATPIGIDLLDPKIYTSGDIERVVGFHPLGTLLKDDEFSSELAAEYYFRLAAGIDHAIRTAGARTFVFTSLTEGSGTSTVVEKTSHKLIELGLRTLTIVASDADAPVIYSNESRPYSELMVRPRPLHSEELQYRPERSQNAALASFGDSAEGTRRRAEHEAPAPNPVARAIHQAGTQYDAVLIDSNPLLLSANTEYLARISDATVLIVASAEATKPQLSRAARLLERLNVPGVAIVLNKIAMARADRALKNDLQQYEQSLDRQRRTNNRKPVWQHKEKIHPDIEAEREIQVEPAPESNHTPSEERQTAV